MTNPHSPIGRDPLDPLRARARHDAGPAPATERPHTLAGRLRAAARSTARVGLVVALVPALAQAQDLYSFDRITHELVRIDPQDGTVTPVVTVDTGGAVVSRLVTLADRLYLKTFTQLLELDIATGSILSAVTLTVSGQAVGSEGIASDGTSLFLAYVSTSLWPSSSDAIGGLVTDGTITHLVSFPVHGTPPGDEGADFDVLTIDPSASDRWLGMNGLVYGNGNDRTEIFRGRIDGTFEPLGVLPALTNFPQGMTTVCGTVYALTLPFPTPLTPYLHRIDPSTGSVLESIPLPPGRELFGLTAFGPRAEAGADQVVRANALVTLDGTGSTSPCGGLAYRWTQVAGPPVALDETDPARPAFAAPGIPGAKLRFELVVDDGLVSAPDAVRVSVRAKYGLAPEPMPLSVAPSRVGGHLRLTVTSSDEIAFALVSGDCEPPSIVHGAGAVADGVSSLAMPLPDDPRLAGTRLRVRAALQDQWTGKLHWTDEVEVVLLGAGIAER